MIVNAMKEHGSNGGVQKNGCGVLRNLGYINADTQKPIGTEDIKPSAVGNGI